MSNVRITVENLLSRVDAFVAWTIESARLEEERDEKFYQEALKRYNNSSWFVRTFVNEEPQKHDWLAHYCIYKTEQSRTESANFLRRLANGSDDGMVTISDSDSFILDEKFNTRTKT